jgi:branched-chain amino acid transport system substrate-binding protein
MEEIMSDNAAGLGKRRRFIKAAGALTAAAGLGFPFVSRAQNKPIRIGVPTILSGRVAQLGISSRNALAMEIEKFNAAGGLGGRKIELIARDSKGKPDEAANNTRHLINSEGCEIIVSAESSAGAFAVQEVIRELKVLCIHTAPRPRRCRRIRRSACPPPSALRARASTMRSSARPTPATSPRRTG